MERHDMRLRGKVAIVVGGGQTPGETIGNGRAAAVIFARQGAKVLVVDRDGDSAQETAELIRKEDGVCHAMCADASSEDDCKAFVDKCVSDFGRLDVLHNNVGIGAGDHGVEKLTEKVGHQV